MGGAARMLPFARRGGIPLGEVRIPGSKSVAVRALILAVLAKGVTECRGLPDGDDTRHLLRALRNLGFPVHEGPQGCRILGGGRPVGGRNLELGASGANLRFLLPWLALECGEPVIFTGEARLFERPLGPLLDLLKGWGARWECRSGWARLSPCTHPPDRLEVELDAHLSSQFLSGLALACAVRPRGGCLRWMGRAASPSYLTLTEVWMRRFGCDSQLREGAWEISPGPPQACDLSIPGDWSGAAAFLCGAAVLEASVVLGPLDPVDPQGDRALLGLLEGVGSTHRWEGDRLCFSGALKGGFQADLRECPDLGPVMMATAALAPEPSRLSGLETLRHKECDRLEAGRELVGWLGGQAEEPEPGVLTIRPGFGPGHRPPYDPRGDHRMAFAAAVGALRRGGGLLSPECVAKTFPAFWNTWEGMLGVGA